MCAAPPGYGRGGVYLLDLAESPVLDFMTWASARSKAILELIPVHLIFKAGRLDAAED